MKKFLMALMAVLFLGATSMVLADEPAAGNTKPAAAPAKSHKGSKHHKGMKKGKKAAAPVASPAAK